jgi:hypothetical protein
MENIVKISDFGQILCGTNGEKLYGKIQELFKEEPPICIDFSDVKAISVIFSKNVFGKLYLEFGSQIFFGKLKFKNTVRDHQLAIQWGIEYAIETNEKELKAAI